MAIYKKIKGRLKAKRGKIMLTYCSDIIINIICCVLTYRKLWKLMKTKIVHIMQYMEKCSLTTAVTYKKVFNIEYIHHLLKQHSICPGIFCTAWYKSCWGNLSRSSLMHVLVSWRILPTWKPPSQTLSMGLNLEDMRAIPVVEYPHCLNNPQQSLFVVFSYHPWKQIYH